MAHFNPWPKQKIWYLVKLAVTICFVHSELSIPVIQERHCEFGSIISPEIITFITIRHIYSTFDRSTNTHVHTKNYLSNLGPKMLSTVTEY